MSLYKIVRSKAYKNFMAKLYGWGASAVIMGALLKIIHAPGADYMLIVGMTTEALIFFFSAFEPLHKEYNWALVYPELGLADASEGKGSVTQQLDNMLADAKIEPALIESLASGMKNLSENAKKLSYTTEATAATEGYVDNLSKAKVAIQNLTGVYEKSASTISATSEMQMKSTQEIIDGQKQYAQNLQKNLSESTDIQAKSTKELFEIQKQHAQKLQVSLTETTDTQLKNVQEMFVMQKQYAQTLQDVQTQHVQKIGQIQEHGTKAIMDNYKKIEDTTILLANSMNDTVKESQQYKQEIDKLSKSVAQINSIYANMLAAMTNK